GQGQIDKILSGKAEDRRELFDEAAGIVKFKRRKHTTMKKLEEERQNLLRVTDILSELTKQLGPLERQAETARIYLAKRDTLRELDINMFLLENDRIGKLLEELSGKTEIAQKELDEKQKEFDETRVSYERFETELAELNRKEDILREETQENAIRRQQLEGQMNVLREQISSGKQNEELYLDRLQSIEEDRGKKNENYREIAEEKSRNRGKLNEIRRQQKQEEERLEMIRSNIEECTASVEDGKNEIIEILNSRATTKGKAQRYDTMLEQIDIRKAQINQRLLHLRTEESAQTKLRDEAKTTYDAITASIDSMSQECQRLESIASRIQQKLKEQNEALEKKQEEYHRVFSKLESLKNLAERYDGYGNSIRKVMEQKECNGGIRGVVADLIQVDKDYEVAIETALGGSIQNIVTDNEQTAKRMIEYLKKNRFGRATFLPLSNISSRGGFGQKEALKEAGVIGIASDLVYTDPEYKELSVYLLGKVLVVDHMDHAIAIAKKYRHSLRMVTIEGELLNPGGSMTGGAFRNTSNLLGRRREIEELEGVVSNRTIELSTIQEAIEENRQRRNMIRETISDFQEKLRASYVEQNTAHMKMTQMESKRKEIEEDYALIDQESDELQKQIREVKEDHNRIEEELQASRKDEKELETYIQDRQNELEEWETEEDDCLKKLEEIRLEEQSLSQKDTFAAENMNRLQEELNSLNAEKENIAEILKNGENEIRQKVKDIENLKDAVEQYTLEDKKNRETLILWQREKEEKSAGRKVLFDKRDELSGTINLLDKEVFRLKSQIEKHEENRESQISYMWEEYEITPNSAKQYRREDLTERSVMKQEIAKIKEEIRRLGTVNVNAIQDYKELLERHTFLAGQYEDLKTAEETLVGIVSELDDGMRRQFSEKFKEIQKEFDKAFKELFGGGKGTLELDEDMDILEAGVRIISQPPGKKLQNMMQLSGGEKALTAIALLFAIQNLKPSPFCLLDEIEAALDDSNVGRFAGYLQKLTKNTQFIIITHRRGTMSAADRLYGITMQEKGVSTLVSVDLVENQLSK
ncbi:MAG: chromosome segregation protein SMC, partial [Blautia sp.]|nr:chromosome segregation protein SMC [Blautia sp.]